jgi:hypothetical protein
MVKNHFSTLNWQIDYFIFKIVDNIFQGEFWEINKEKLQFFFSKQWNKIIDYKNWNFKNMIYCKLRNFQFCLIYIRTFQST